MNMSTRLVRFGFVAAVSILFSAIPLVAQSNARELLEQARDDFDVGLDGTSRLVKALRMAEKNGNLGLLVDVGLLLAENGKKEEAYNAFDLALQKAEPSPSDGNELHGYIHDLLDLSNGFVEIEHLRNALSVLEIALKAAQDNNSSSLVDQIQIRLYRLRAGGRHLDTDPSSARNPPTGTSQQDSPAPPRTPGSTAPATRQLLAPPPFDYEAQLYGISLPRYREKYLELSGFDSKLAKLEADVGELPGASGQGLAKILTSIDLIENVSAQAHQARMARLAAEYLTGLDAAFSETGLAPRCTGVDPAGPAELERQTMQQARRLQDALEEDGEFWEIYELDYNDAFVCSSLDTLSPAPDVAPDPRSDDRERLSPEESALSYRVKLAPLRPPARTFNGFSGLDLPSGDLGSQITEVRRQVLSGRPRRAGSAELADLEGRRMRTLAAVLFRVTRLTSALEHGEEMLGVQSRLERQRQAMAGCVARLDEALLAMGDRVRGAVRSRLETLRREHLGLTAPPLVTDLRQWQSRHTREAATAPARLDDMARDLRAMSRVRRQVWCQMRRQAELESQLGPRRN